MARCQILINIKVTGYCQQYCGWFLFSTLPLSIL